MSVGAGGENCSCEKLRALDVDLAGELGVAFAVSHMADAGQMNDCLPRGELGISVDRFGFAKVESRRCDGMSSLPEHRDKMGTHETVRARNKDPHDTSR